MNIEEPPKRCQEIPGFIVKIGHCWLTNDGRLTITWGHRGIWNTPQEAERARLDYLSSDELWKANKAHEPKK